VLLLLLLLLALLPGVDMSDSDDDLAFFGIENSPPDSAPTIAETKPEPARASPASPTE